MMTVFLKSTVRPLRIGDATVVEHLQQHVEHVRMRLLDFVEQNHRVRLPPHGLGQLPAFIVTDITRRRADEPRDAVLLHVFAPIEAYRGEWQASPPHNPACGRDNFSLRQNRLQPILPHQRRTRLRLEKTD